MDNITDGNGVVFSPDKKTLIRVPETMKGVYEVPFDPAGCAAMLVAGDFLEKRHYDSAKDLNNDPFFSWCKANPDVLVFLTAGNHDRPAERHRDWFDWPKNVIRLHEDTRIVLFKGLRIFGTPWTEQHGNGVFQVEKDALPAKYAVIPKDLDILVAHATPLLEGTGSDADVRPGYGHIGSEALRDAIREKKPKVVVCGHVHADDHAVAKIGNSSIVNVSRVKGSARNGHAAFSPAYIEFRADGSFDPKPAKSL